MGNNTSTSKSFDSKECLEKSIKASDPLTTPLNKIKEQLATDDFHTLMGGLDALEELIDQMPKRKSYITAEMLEILHAIFTDVSQAPDIRDRISNILVTLVQQESVASGAPNYESLEVMAAHPALLDSVNAWQTDPLCSSKKPVENLAKLIDATKALSCAAQAIRDHAPEIVQQEIINSDMEMGGGGEAVDDGQAAAVVGVEANPERAIISHADLVYDEVTDFVAEGGFGKLFRAQWAGQQVGFKKLKIGQTTMAELEHEGSMMSKLSHRNIVKFFGFCMDPGQQGLVMEYIPGGSLYGFLNNDKTADITWSVRIKLAYGITEGLSYLHQQHIFHRDLKSLNILMGEDQTAKITDFGLSKYYSKSQVTQSACKGSFVWMAPELFEDGAKYTVESDIYSLACVFQELATRDIPWAGRLLPMILLAVRMGVRPDIPEGTPVKFAELIGKCWAHDCRERPPLAKVSEDLQVMMAEAGAPFVPR